ncbi:epimerase [Thalassococcus sp. S3]|uniref:epimerase n=1 Tax=Thalassococcus sp. S3 TaxID=2017482 RepID=UPI001023F771|nr:epimerase [Thalassococcus sp. S3]QBF33193.1 epimerase [Thalassococcus sp. S3]
MTKSILVLGATGRFGRNVAATFEAAGWHVKRFDRKRGTLLQAAMGVDVIANGWNPPYPDWPEQVPHLTKQVIEAAASTGATVLMAGNVYVFGPDNPDTVWSAGSPHRATNTLGRIRIEMEEQYRLSGVPTILLRAGDFIDTERSGNWFDRILIKSLEKGQMTYPGNPDIPHAWAYLPDVARAALALVEMRSDLPTFIDVPFPGYTLSGRELAAGLGRVTAKDITLRPMAWWPLWLATPFWTLAKSLREMRYLWNTPHQMDDADFKTLLPDFQSTPVDTALASAIR